MKFKLSEVRILNFLSYKDVTFSGINKFNVLIGKNNSGKSNLIKIMKFLHSNCQSNEFDPSIIYDSKEDIDAELILTIKLTNDYRTEILDLLYKRQYLYKHFTDNEMKEGFLKRNQWKRKDIALPWLLEKGLFNYFKFYIRYFKDKKNLFLDKITAVHNEYDVEQIVYKIQEDRDKDKILLNNYVQNDKPAIKFETYFTHFSSFEASDLRNVSLYNTLRSIPSNLNNSIAKNPVFCKALLEVLGGFISNIKIIPHDRHFRPSSDRTNLAETELSLDGSNFVKYLDKLNSTDEREWVDDLNNEIITFFPNVKELTYTVDNSDRSVLILKENELRSKIELEKMGAGILNIVFFLTWIKILQEGYFLFIEEPELFIFPGLQKKILNKFLDVSEDIQIFITTHSIHYLSEDETKCTAYSIQKIRSQSIVYKVPNGDFPEIIKNIGSVIGEYENEQILIYNDQLWNNFIQKALNSEEDLLWDFKETLDWWNPHCKDKEKKQVQFSEKVGGFANADGGLIIIGITNTKPRQIVGFEKFEERSKNINKIIRSRTSFRPSSCKMREILIPNYKDKPKSCLFLFIPQTKEVVEVINIDDTISFPLRVGLEVIKKTNKEIEKLKRKVYLNNFNFINQIKKFTQS
ncbi:hypothetical protein LCGC14_0290600 [marine sediment metagenome]|uniref:AAA domain-containing protein n=1 Tax=marine sediment metagenome TaxID=412755 RepID=A0A0F9WEE8_9ZZZZ